MQSHGHCTVRWIGPCSASLQLRKPHSSFPAEPIKCCQGWELGYWNHGPLVLPFNPHNTLVTPNQNIPHSMLPSEDPCLASSYPLVCSHTGNFQFLIADQWGRKLKHTVRWEFPQSYAFQLVNQSDWEILGENKSRVSVLWMETVPRVHGSRTQAELTS